jgi:CRISPR-associated exonuclease Cas4
MPVPFSDLRVAAYCPRKLYYRRREPDRSPPEIVTERRDLATCYPDLLAADDATLRELPIEKPPPQYRRRLRRTRERLDCWEEVVEPITGTVFLEGRDCHGLAHKVLGDPPRPSIVSPGDPPEAGVWEPHSVQAVAAAKALAWERQRPVESAVVEYPAHGAIREIELTTRRKAQYREALRAVADLDGPPSRVENEAKCEPCEYAGDCGVRSRSLGSLLGD